MNNHCGHLGILIVKDFSAFTLANSALFANFATAVKFTAVKF